MKTFFFFFFFFPFTFLSPLGSAPSTTSAPAADASATSVPALPFPAALAAALAAPGGATPAPAAALHSLARRVRGREPEQSAAGEQDLPGGPGHPAELHPGRGPVPRRGGHPHPVSPAGPAQAHHHQVLPQPAHLRQPPRQAEGPRGLRGGPGQLQGGRAAEGPGREHADQQHHLLHQDRGAPDRRGPVRVRPRLERVAPALAHLLTVPL